MIHIDGLVLLQWDSNGVTAVLRKAIDITVLISEVFWVITTVWSDSVIQRYNATLFIECPFICNWIKGTNFMDCLCISGVLRISNTRKTCLDAS